MTSDYLTKDHTTMPSMDQLVSEYYAQNNSAPDFEKEAQVELFAKLAADNGIDLEQLSEDQIGYLWNETFNKTAGEDEPKDEKKEHEEKVEKAKEEHEEKKAAVAKLAEADFLGRYMAHAMTDEIKKIAEDKTAGTADLRKAKGVFGRAGQLLSGTRKKELSENLTTLKGGLQHNSGTSANPEAQKKLKSQLHKVIKGQEGQHKDEARKVLGARVGAGAAGAAAVGGGVAAGRASKKEASAIDQLAAELAIEKAASVGWDEEEATERVASVMTLDLLGESEKVAMAQDLETAVDVRSLEYLEAAGYPVTWAE